MPNRWYVTHTHTHTYMRVRGTRTFIGAHTLTLTPAIFCGTLPANIRIVLSLMLASYSRGSPISMRETKRVVEYRGFRNYAGNYDTLGDASNARCIDVKIATAVGDCDTREIVNKTINLLLSIAGDDDNRDRGAFPKS